MSSVKFLEPSGSNLSSEQIPRTNLTNITVSRNVDSPWIFSNYPEALYIGNDKSPLADGCTQEKNGYYINQQQVSGETEIFYSHTNCSGKVLKFRIHIYNCTDKPVTVNRTNMGHYCGWSYPENAVKEYFKGNSATFTLPSGGSAWLTPEYTISVGNPFTGMVRLVASNDIIVTEYLYIDPNKINGYEVAYPEDLSSYVITGIGHGNFITFNHALRSADETKVSTLKSRPYVYATNSHNKGEVNPNELVPIKLLGTDIIADGKNQDYHYNDLGNYCAHNYHIIKFTNDTLKPATIYGYIGSDGIGNTQVINRGGVIKSAKLDLDTGVFQWRWCQVDLAAGESVQFDFQQLVASYGAAASIMKWALA